MLIRAEAGEPVVGAKLKELLASNREDYTETHIQPGVLRLTTTQEHHSLDRDEYQNEISGCIHSRLKSQ
jgi:hypothetical protein